MIANIFRPSRMVNGKRQKSRLYSARIRLDGETRVEQIPLKVSDKQVAQQKLRALVLEREKEASGILPAASFRQAVERKLIEHIEDFIAEREHNGRNGRYLRELKAKLLRLCRECHWQQVKDVSADRFLN